MTEKKLTGGERIRQAVDSETDSRKRPYAQARERASIVAESWANFGGRNRKGTASFNVKGTAIHVSNIEFCEEDGDIPSCVLIWTGGNSVSPQYKLINPPILVEDPQGDVELQEETDKGDFKSTRYREDPIKAVIDSIASIRRGN